MIVEIPTPDLESRMQILRTKARLMNIPVADEIIEYLASSIEGNVRELEGVLNSIAIQSQLKGKDLSITDIKQLVKHAAKPKKSISVKDLIKLVADFYNIEEGSIYEKTRKKEVVRPRQLIMFLLREDFSISYPSIGEKMGGRDHTTVIHSCEKIKEELKSDTALTQELQQIRSMLV
jgi:chromosomal replication initiator protein